MKRTIDRFVFTQITPDQTGGLYALDALGRIWHYCGKDFPGASTFMAAYLTTSRAWQLLPAPVEPEQEAK